MLAASSEMSYVCLVLCAGKKCVDSRRAFRPRSLGSHAEIHGNVSSSHVIISYPPPPPLCAPQNACLGAGQKAGPTNPIHAHDESERQPRSFMTTTDSMAGLTHKCDYRACVELSKAAELPKSHSDAKRFAYCGSVRRPDGSEMRLASGSERSRLL
jgi:hypothetical protein